MLDHIHLVWMGLRFDTDQLNGMAFLRTHLEPLLHPAKFQPQAHDHVLSQHWWKGGQSVTQTRAEVLAGGNASPNGGVKVGQELGETGGRMCAVAGK